MFFMLDVDGEGGIVVVEAIISFVATSSSCWSGLQNALLLDFVDGRWLEEGGDAIEC